MSRQLDADEITNAQDDQGMTILMMAAAKGNLAIVKLLSFIPGTDFGITDKRKMTALDYAKKMKKMKVAQWLMSDMTDAPESDEDEVDDAPIEDKSKAGEKAMDLSRAKLSAMRAKGLVSKREKDEDDETQGDERVWWIRNSCPELKFYPAVVFGIVVGYLGPDKCPSPVWEGLKEALSGEQLDVHIRRQDEDPEEEKALIASVEEKTHMQPGAYFNVDPSLFYANKMRTLELRLAKGVLTQMPVSLGRLSQLLSLNLSHNSLVTLPDVFGRLRQLKSLDLNDNQLTRLPLSLAKCSKLEALFASENKLEDVAPLETGLMSNLVTIRLDSNQLSLLHRVPFASPAFGRLRTLSLAHNPMRFLPASVGKLPALEELDCRSCALEDLPATLNLFAKKKMNTMLLTGNPLKDRRLAKEVTKAEEGEARPLKQLLTYMAKHSDKLNAELEKKYVQDDEKKAKAEQESLEAARKARAEERKKLLAGRKKGGGGDKNQEESSSDEEGSSSGSESDEESDEEEETNKNKNKAKGKPPAKGRAAEEEEEEQESNKNNNKAKGKPPPKGKAAKEEEQEANKNKNKDKGKPPPKGKAGEEEEEEEKQETNKSNKNKDKGKPPPKGKAAEEAEETNRNKDKGKPPPKGKPAAAASGGKVQGKEKEKQAQKKRGGKKVVDSEEEKSSSEEEEEEEAEEEEEEEGEGALLGEVLPANRSQKSVQESDHSWNHKPHNAICTGTIASGLADSAPSK
eukprot:gb/GEZN01000575.1/.p1 GENE.gb/GEZN01000575.1/~~gb/GEZN01000575.1/.p1  ORF type:complete len:826 (+),score=251.08 gb/GEZN01000575.1/:257-2479(+)